MEVEKSNAMVRLLQESNTTSSNSTMAGSTDTGASTGWGLLSEDQKQLYEVIYTCFVLFLMFVALISDKVGADMVMIGALSLYMVGQIITLEEALVGFSNGGLLSVLALFVVAEGISKTGALDWYMGKLLGRPTSASSAQMKLMGPIAVISAFLNNTPVVAVMIPIVQKWSADINISAQQLLMPLSFASILGGTCTLIGTSTNLVVAGLLAQMYPNQPEFKIGLFDLSLYGVPIAMIGMVYILLTSPCLLPGGEGCRNKKSRGAIDVTKDFDGGDEDMLLGAVVRAWSPMAGSSIKRSGVRNAKNVYLVSVYSAETGEMHRAVGPDFVLSVNDVLYFTGIIEGFGDFCEEYGLEVLSADLDDSDVVDDYNDNGITKEKGTFNRHSVAEPIMEESVHLGIDTSTAKDTEVAAVQTDNFEISQMTDLIRGTHQLGKGLTQQERRIARRSLVNCEPGRKSRLSTAFTRASVARKTSAPKKVVILQEHGLIFIGIDIRDRPNILQDISSGLTSFGGLTIRHSEAAVVNGRSISIWRCESTEPLLSNAIADLRSALNKSMETSTRGSVMVQKQPGSKVIRAVVTDESALNGRKASEVDFYNKYKAAFIAIHRGGKDVPLNGLEFKAGDLLILKANDESALSRRPPEGFYDEEPKEMKSGTSSKLMKSGTSSKFMKSMKSTATKITGSWRSGSFRSGSSKREVGTQEEQAKRESDIEALEWCTGTTHEKDAEIWKNLFVFFADDNNARSSDAREFLAGMEVSSGSKLAGKTATDSGLSKRAGVFLVSIDRPTENRDSVTMRVSTIQMHDLISGGRSSMILPNADGETGASPAYTTISPLTPLEVGDILWFAGGAQAVGDLRKIPGLISHQSDNVRKLGIHDHDRRLVEAVVARRGPLVGKTPKSISFRNRYGAVIVAVHRDGSRIHDHPSNIVLKAGDVLLCETGPSFMKGSLDHDNSFSLVAEVKDSAPPRLHLLIPALLITIIMLAVVTAGVLNLVTAALLASMVMIGLGILSEQEARDAVNWNIFVTIGSAFGIGTALVNSGVAGGLANFLVTIGTLGGLEDVTVGVFAAVYFATFLISNVVTNNAAAALIFPIAIDAANQTGADALVMSYCVMLGASASFMSPFGYQTNMMVYQPGGYVYNDFLLIGTPMQLILWVVSVLLLETTTGGNFYWSWLISFLLLVIVASFGVLKSFIMRKRGADEAEVSA